MKIKQFPALALAAALSLLAVAFPAAAQQDVVTVQSVTASGSTVDVPVYIRDIAGTPLGKDRPAGSRIQSYSIKVSYSPASAVAGVTFGRAGITANLSPTTEFAPASGNSISLLDTFQESSNSIPFTLNAGAPGNQVAHLVVTLSSSAAPGSQITLTLDPTLTQLTDEGGSAATKETVANGSLSLVNGTITVPPLSVNITPSSRTTTPNGNANFTATISAAVASPTTVTLSSANTAVATVPASVVIAAGSQSATFVAHGVAKGQTTITASISPTASDTATITVTDAPPPCNAPAAPVITGPATAEAGTTYTISWPSVVNATDYEIDEATDAAFTTAITQSLTATSATFTHVTPNLRYYYRVRARNRGTGCDLVSASSDAISVLVTLAAQTQTRYLPVVGSAPGSFGSFFKTAVQLYNPHSSPATGRIVYHPQGVSGSSSDPFLAFTVAPSATVRYADLLPAMGAPSGVGSADVVIDAGASLPVMLVRVFSDAGAAGTTGLVEDMLADTDALKTGDSGVLLAPADITRFRLNVGVRTLSSATTLNVTVRDAAGTIVKTLTKSYDPTFFAQVGSAAFLDGYALQGNESITIDVTAGKAFVYGSTTDNTTNDPAVQFARRVD